MYIILISLIWALFAAALFLNVYFRVKVFKVYKTLVQARIEFDSSHIFSPTKMEQEILPKYPKNRADILLFVSHIRYSIKMATVLTTLITMFGAVLMWYRK
jgi:hypothetical protein